VLRCSATQGLPSALARSGRPSLSKTDPLGQNCMSNGGRDLTLRRVRLRDIVWLREEKYGDLLVWHIANINGAMRLVTWLVPIDLPGCEVDMLLWTSVSEFNSQSVTLEDDRYAMQRISMPSRGFARCEQ